MEETQEISVTLSAAAVKLLHGMLVKHYNDRLTAVAFSEHAYNSLPEEERDIPGEGHDGTPREKIANIRHTMWLLWEAIEQFDKAIEGSEK